MRVKTYLATYLLFLLVLFSSLGIVSVYMSNNQLTMLREKSEADYHMISASLLKDLPTTAAVEGRILGDTEIIARGYSRYYRQHKIEIGLVEAGEESKEIAISFHEEGIQCFVTILGKLPAPLGAYRLDYRCDVTENIADLRDIQTLLLVVAVGFSLVTGILLYWILFDLFRPLALLVQAARKIAGGLYGERIQIQGNHEFSAVAADFNRMAEEVEKQICLLEEEALQKQRFVDNFAHEIRTPLTSVYGYAEYLRRAALSEAEIQESTQSIMEEANHMRKIASSLLELATLRQYTPVKSRILISGLFEDIRKSIESLPQAQKARVTCQVAVSDILMGQEDLIRSLLLNLCYNALNACPGHGCVIHLSAKRCDGDFVLAVADNGCGIPQDSLTKVTDPFYRVDKARSRASGGAGLGLSLCRQIALVHGARMEIDSIVDVGTKVRITFTSPE